MKVFLTGATGFVGLNITKALLEAGHEPHCYVRSSSNTSYLERFDVTLHLGELSDLEVATAAMAGCDAVIHCAGNTGTYPWEVPGLEAVNVRGTETMIEAALANNIHRFVYTSTSSTIGAGNTKERRWDEDTPLTGFRARNPYGISKIAAEKLVLDAMERGLEPIILNPTEVMGAYDHNLQWGRMVLAVCADQVPFVPPGSGSFCHAAEVGKAHVAALTRGTLGQRYLLAGADTTYASLLSTISDVTGIAFTDPCVDYQQRFFDALYLEKTYHLTGELPMVDPYRMRVFRGHYFFDDSRAQADLGYGAGCLEDMIRDAYGWYRKNGFLPEAAPESEPQLACHQED